MSPQTTLNRAAAVLRRVTPSLPADAALRTELAAHRQYSPAERRAVVRAVFSFYRWNMWLDERASLQSQLEAALTLQARFDNSPTNIKAEALAARAVPAWLKDELALTPDYLRQLQRDPALWLRTRLGRTAGVAKELRDCVPAGEVLGQSLPETLCYTGPRDLFLTEPFQKGLFEIQDLASQLIGRVCAPEPGQTWWDACAGEGGKSLHLADLMQGRGLLWASDRSERRLAVLQKRAARAEVFNYRQAAWEGSAQLPTKTKFDGILLDAPCSGVGTWQRNPHARWTTTPADVAELAATQASLLANVAPALKPGGRLVYAVCTLTRSETTAIADAFTAAHSEFEPVPVFANRPETALTFWPQELNANGMFVATWRRKA